MARVTLTKTVAAGSYPSLPVSANALDITWTAADASNKNQFRPTGRELILAWNTHATDPYTITVTSALDDKNRDGDVTAYSLAAGDVAVLGPMQIQGWRQADGYVYLEASDASVKFAVIQIP